MPSSNHFHRYFVFTDTQIDLIRCDIKPGTVFGLQGSPERAAKRTVMLNRGVIAKKKEMHLLALALLQYFTIQGRSSQACSVF